MRSSPSPDHDTPPSESHTAQEPERHESIVATVGTTYYFDYKITQIEAIFSHNRTEDLCDWFGWFGFQPHRAIDGYQVQSRSKHKL